MTDNELRTHIEQYRNEHGDAVPVSELLHSFQGFQPSYTPRRGSADPTAAERAAKLRAFLRLVETIEANVGTLTTRPAQASVDIKQLATRLGHEPPKRLRFVIPDHVLVLDDTFFEFTQSLPPSIGGSKRRATPRRRGTQELEAFRAALHELRASRSDAAEAFLAVYDRVQPTLRLPKP